MKPSSFLYLLTASLGIFLLSFPAAGQSFQRTIYSGPGLPQDVLAADLNQDGKPDLLTTQADDGGVIFLNRGDGTFPDGGLGLNSNGFPATRAVAADFNGDGITDVAVESCSSGGLTLLILSGDADHTFHVTSGADRNSPPFASSCTDAMALITIVNDALPSVMVSSLDTSVTIFRNDGTGPFPQQQQRVAAAPGMILAGASVGDFNGDHLQDIAAVSRNPNGGPEQVVVFYQNPDGSFQPPVTVFSLDATLQITRAVNFNDGAESDELLVPFFGGSEKRAGVVALTHAGHKRFRSTVLLADPFYTSAGQKADVIHSQGKHEGVRGIVVPFSPEPSTGDSVFAFFPAQGNTWGKPVYFDDPGGQGAQAVTSADFNGDGRPDFAGIDNNNHLLVFLNTTTEHTCDYPRHAGVRICSPDFDSNHNSRNGEIHASASGGALPVVAMKAYIDGNLVAESSMNTLDASMPAEAGRHTLTVSATDSTGRVYQRSMEFHAR